MSQLRKLQQLLGLRSQPMATLPLTALGRLWLLRSLKLSLAASSMFRCGAVLCCAVLCCAALRCAALCCAVLCCAAHSDQDIAELVLLLISDL